MTYKPTLCLDFDGVIHSYTSKWVATEIIPDPPVPGALEFIYEAQSHFRVCIFSTRSATDAGRAAMSEWMRKWAIALLGEGRFEDDPNLMWLDHIHYPTSKPSALVTLDDRAITFEGEFPSIESLLSFKPWNKR